ncbi:MAG: hypothetical protein MOGDAGHF_00712 [Rhodocyclaceae bacterium]|nr:hypothetical protein [Rhodocyclaceae bacterium]
MPKRHRVNLWVKLSAVQLEKIRRFVVSSFAEFEGAKARDRRYDGCFNASKEELLWGLVMISEPQLIRVTESGISIPKLGFLNGVGAPQPFTWREYAAIRNLAPRIALLMWRRGHWTVRLTYGMNQSKPTVRVRKCNPRKSGKQKKNSSSIRESYIRDRRPFKEIIWADDFDALQRKQEALKKIERKLLRGRRAPKAVIFSGGAFETNKRKH